MLTFPEDSDRTVSLDTESDNFRLLAEENGCTSFQKPCWRLSPLLERFEEKSECIKGDTNSELSSLPEDGKLINLSTSDEKTDFSVYPTYSLQERFSEQKGIDADAYDSNYDKKVLGFSREESESCSECEFQKIVWSDASFVKDKESSPRNKNVPDTQRLSGSPLFKDYKIYDLEGGSLPRSRCDEITKKVLSDAEENTFSIYTHRVDTLQ